MNEKKFYYVIIGSGLAGVSAVEGIREIDKQHSILLIGGEPVLPYDRPPLTKKLWSGKKNVEDIYLHDRAFYDTNSVAISLGTTVTQINKADKTVTTDKGELICYEKLLIATGGFPRTLEIPGGKFDEICYFRTLKDYQTIRKLAQEGKKAVIIGGGFIGSELAAALNSNKLAVTMIFPEEYLVKRIFPEELGRSIQEHYTKKGVTILKGDVPVSFEKRSGQIVTRTKNGKEIASDIVVAGLGIKPAEDLARNNGLKTNNGITVNEFLQTSNPDIYAAGDIANFFYPDIGERMRVEHWDNSISQGKSAGRNMAGAGIRHKKIPYFFSDLFEFGYEAVGMINSQLETVTDWKKENDTGIIYYLKDSLVKGVMLCNVWEKTDAARDLILGGKEVRPGDLKGAIPFE